MAKRVISGPLFHESWVELDNEIHDFESSVMKDNQSCNIFPALCDDTRLTFVLYLESFDRVIFNLFPRQRLLSLVPRNAAFDGPSSVCLLLCNFISPVSKHHQRDGSLCDPVSTGRAFRNHGAEGCDGE